MVLIRKLWVLMVTSFVDMMGFLIVHPLLPFYAEREGADAFVIGLLVACFPLGQLITAPLWGRLSDTYGRKPILLAGLLLSAVSFGLFSFADSLVTLFIFRLLQGAGGGTTGVVMAYVSDVVPSGERAQGLGWISAASSAGVMIGPAIGSFATRFGAEGPGIVAAVLCLLNFLFALTWLPRTEPDPKDEHGPARVSILRALSKVVLHPRQLVHRLMWIYALGMMAFMALNGILAVYLKDKFGVTEQTIGWYFTYVGAVSVLMRAVLLGPIVRRFGEVFTMRCGAFSLGLGLALAPIAWNIPALAVATLFIPVGTALLFPSTTSQISRGAAKGETGETLGVQQTFGGISRVLGPTWAGAVYAGWGQTTPFWAGAFLMLIVLLLTLRLRRPRALGAEEPGRLAPIKPS